MSQNIGRFPASILTTSLLILFDTKQYNIRHEAFFQPGQFDFREPMNLWVANC